MKRSIQLCLSALLLLALLAIPNASSAEVLRDVALGGEGEVYMVLSGRCESLLVTCPGDDATPILVLDIIEIDKAVVRLLVPGSADSATEVSPALVYEDSSDSLFVVWESRENESHSRVYLVWLEDGEWSDVIEVSGNSEPLKGAPQLAITRDSYEVLDAAGAPRQLDRTVLHVTWWEGGAEREEIFYTPIVLENGDYLGSNQVINLSALDPHPSPPSPLGISPSLYRSPTIDRGRDERTVVIGFTNPASERFLVFESQLLPGEVSGLSDSVAQFVLAEPSPTSADEMVSLGDRLRGHMIDIGHRLHPAHVGHLADQTAAAVAAADPTEATDPISFSDRLRGHMIDIGARLYSGGGLITQQPLGVEAIVEISPPREPGAATATSPAHLARLQLVQDLPAPQVANSLTWIFLSLDGRRAVVSWDASRGLDYLETNETGTGWDPRRRLALSGQIDQERAEQLLRQRVRPQ